MSNTDRDTQFLGFAGKVIEEMMVDHDKNLVVFDWDLEEQSRLATILARRAYDLVVHACEAVEDKEQEYESRITSSYMTSIVPDLPDLPREGKV